MYVCLCAVSRAASCSRDVIDWLGSLSVTQMHEYRFSFNRVSVFSVPIILTRTHDLSITNLLPAGLGMHMAELTNWAVSLVFSMEIQSLKLSTFHLVGIERASDGYWS